MKFLFKENLLLTSLIGLLLFFAACDKKKQQKLSASELSVKVECRIDSSVDTTTTVSEYGKTEDTIPERLRTDANKLAEYLRNIPELRYYADTMMDVNGDSYLDLIMESYAMSGFGHKYLHTVYLFHPQKKVFIKALDNVLNLGCNPKEKTFTSTYFGRDFTGGQKYKWEGFESVLLETASRRNFIENSQQTVCSITNHLTKKIVTSENCEDCFPEKYFRFIELK